MASYYGVNSVLLVPAISCKKGQWNDISIFLGEKTSLGFVEFDDYPESNNQEYCLVAFLTPEYRERLLLSRLN